MLDVADHERTRVASRDPFERVREAGPGEQARNVLVVDQPLKLPPGLVTRRVDLLERLAADSAVSVERHVPDGSFSGGDDQRGARGGAVPVPHVPAEATTSVAPKGPVAAARRVRATGRNPVSTEQCGGESDRQEHREQRDLESETRVCVPR